MGKLLLKTDRNLPQSEPDIDPCDLLASKACSDWPQAKRSLSAVKSRRSLSTVKEKRKQKKAQIVYRTGTSRYMSCHATRHKQCTRKARHATSHVMPQGTKRVQHSTTFINKSSTAMEYRYFTHLCWHDACGVFQQLKVWLDFVLFLRTFFAFLVFLFFTFLRSRVFLCLLFLFLLFSFLFLQTKRKFFHCLVLLLKCTSQVTSCVFLNNNNNNNNNKQKTEQELQQEQQRNRKNNSNSNSNSNSQTRSIDIKLFFLTVTVAVIVVFVLVVF